MRGQLWRFVVALALVPLVFFAGPPAQAATSVQTDWVPVKWHDPGHGVGIASWGAYDCQTNVSMRKDALGQKYVRFGAGYCQGGIDANPFGCSGFEVDCIVFTFSVKGAPSATCDTIHATPAAIASSHDTWSHQAAGWGAFDALAGDCDPTEVCLNTWSVGYDGIPPAPICVQVNLDPPVTAAPVVNQCNWGEVVKPVTISGGKNEFNASQWRYWGEIEHDLSNLPASPSNWRPYVIVTTSGTLVSGTTALANPTGTPVGFILGPSITGSAQVPKRWKFALSGTGVSSATVPAQNEYIIGSGYIREGANMTTTATPNMNGANHVLPQTDATFGLAGMTTPARCSWYWGAKVAFTSTDTFDEPTGDLPEADYFPPVETAPPSGDLPPGTGEPDSGAGEQPTTDSGMWAAILQVLRMIWGAITALGTAIAAVASAVTAIGVSIVSAVVGIGQSIVAAVGSLLDGILGIAGAIVDGVTDLFMYLFVPDSLALSGEVDDTISAWDDTAIAKWKDGFTGQAFSFPGSGCGGIPVDINLPGGVAADFNLGAACSGGVASAAGMVKAISTGALVIFGGLGCLRALGSGFGWNPGIGKPGAA